MSPRAGSRLDHSGPRLGHSGSRLDHSDSSLGRPGSRLDDEIERDAATANPVFALMRAITVHAALLLVVVAAAGALAGWMLFGMAGLWASLLALAVLCVYELPTQIVFALLALRRPRPDDYALTVGVVWLIKIGVLIGLFMLLQGFGWFHHALFAALVVVGAAGVLAVEVWQVARCRIPYVDPGAGRRSSRSRG